MVDFPYGIQQDSKSWANKGVTPRKTATVMAQLTLLNGMLGWTKSDITKVMWIFPEMGVPHFIIHVISGFPYGGTPIDLHIPSWIMNCLSQKNEINPFTVSRLW